MRGRVMGAVAALLFAGGLGSAAWGETVPVLNGSFETPDSATPFTVSTKIDNWTTYGDAPFDTGGGPNSSGTGTFKNQKPDTTLHFSNATGAQVAYMFTKSSIGQTVGMEQILTGEKFEAGKVYIVSVDVGLAGAAPQANDPLTIELFYYNAGNPSARPVAAGATQTIYNRPEYGLSGTALTRIDVASILIPGGDPSLGNDIGINIFTAAPTDAAATAGRQYILDNVRVVEVPEPGVMGLAVVAAVGALVRRRRR